MYKKIKILLRKNINTIVGFFIGEKTLIRNLENKIIIFCYHNITNKPSKFCENYNLFVNIENFKTQINFIKRNFEIIDIRSLADPNFCVPKNAAIITFDDGFEGTFKNGLYYLNLNGIPSVVFLNMGHILENKPMVSAVAKYLEENKNQYSYLSIKKNFHHHIKVSEYLNLICCPELRELVLNYQGPIASESDLHMFQNSKYIAFANHYYQHFDSRVLSIDEIRSQIIKNEEFLQKYNNSTNFFAFTNGTNSEREIKLLMSLNLFCRILTSSGSASFNKKYVLDRMALDNSNANVYTMKTAIYRALK